MTRADGGKTGVGRGYGGARIDLENLSTTDPHSRQLLAAQIIWTLSRAGINGPYVINADGAALDDRFADGWQTSDVAATDPGAADGAAAGLHALVDGSLVSLQLVQLRIHRPLARDRRRRLEAAELADRIARVALGEPEATAHAALEGRHREVAAPTLDRFDQRQQPRGRLGEVAVAEQHRGRGIEALQRGGRGGGHVAALAVRAVAADHGRARAQRDGPGVVARGVVGDPEVDPGGGRAQRPQRGADPIALVPRSHDRDPLRDPGGFRFRRHRRLFCRPVPDIPAHITGTVWKIEVAVGDQVDLDDTVVILESMKMEMPVEAEDAGTVTEIRCAEGQSVSEGDVLVVLDS